MTVAADGTSIDQDDPRYREGLTHLQAGEWQDAIRCFEALLREYPDSRLVQQALDDARLKATIDATSRIRAKRWAVNWRAIVFRLLIIALIVLTAIGGYQLVKRQFAPALAQAQELRQQKQLLAEGNARLAAHELDAAEASYEALLKLVQNQPEGTQIAQTAQEGLAQIKTARALDALYKQAVADQEAGNLVKALSAFTDLSVKSPAYRDVNIRITAIKKQQGLDQLFADAEADIQAGRAADAVTKYEQLKALNTGYQSELVASRLFGLYMKLGSALIAGDQARAEDVPAAADYFSKALALQPRNTQAQLEQQLTDLYRTAESDYRAGNWERAASGFEAVYIQRPDYLGGNVIDSLYAAYIRSGDDSLTRKKDCGYAYEQYRKAAELSVTDRSLAVSRVDESRLCLTPTPVPTVTPTATPYIPPTGVPTATPAPPLASFRNQIVFKADNEQKPGFWVMNPDGSNARYLGDSADLQKQADVLVEQAKVSPDGRYHVYVEHGEAQDSPQLFIQAYDRNQYGTLDTWQVTHYTGLNYDPAWAPDGSRIAYVSTHQGTDDIWVINIDGTNAWNYTRNKWEWDKHPSWSPDSQKIVFWSNREGTKQIYMIDANGQNLKKVHATTWDEYDPIWIK